jgi:hypothetical protein
VSKKESPNFPAPTTLTEVANFADGAMWLWTPSLKMGRLAAFKGGTVQVSVEIVGLSEDDAVRAAKAVASQRRWGARQGRVLHIWERPATAIVRSPPARARLRTPHCSRGCCSTENPIPRLTT